MSVSPVFNDLGTLLSLTSATLANGTFTYGVPVATSCRALALHGTVTFHTGASAKITLTVQADTNPGIGFAPINFFVPGFGPASTTVQFDPAAGTTQSFWIFTDNAWGIGQLKVGAESNGVAVSGDTVVVTGRASVS